jgi:hypothetical protein
MLHILIKCIFAFLAIAANVPTGFSHLLRQRSGTGSNNNANNSIGHDYAADHDRELQGLCRNNGFVACNPSSNGGLPDSRYGFQMCVDLGGAGKLNLCTPTPFPNSGATFRPTDTCGCCGGKCPNRQTCTCGCIDSITGSNGILMETQGGGTTAAPRRAFCAAGSYEVQDGFEISLADMLINLADSPFRCIPATDARCTVVIESGDDNKQQEPVNPNP